MTTITLTEADTTKIAYSYFTLREWKIIADALLEQKDAAKYYKIDGVYVSHVEIDHTLTKCPSASITFKGE